MRQANFTYEELIECAHGRLFGRGNARLPLPPMLMFDRITRIDDADGTVSGGVIEADFVIHSDAWFFACHFEDDPVMPGCLGLDALWQLIGFYLGWLGYKGRGRALAAGKVRFSGQVLRDVSRIMYRIDIKRVLTGRLTMGVADGKVFADDQPIYEARDLRVGLIVE